MNRKALIEALQKVMPGIDSKETLMEGADSFMFDKDYIRTFNDFISVSYKFETGLECMVKGKEFFQILQKLESEEVKLLVLDDGKFQLSGGKTTLKMPMADKKGFEKTLADNIILSTVDWHHLPESFSKGLQNCVIFAANNDIYASLCAVSIGSDGIVSSDNFRASWYHECLDPKEPFVIPIKAAIELAKVEDIKKYAMKGSWIHFETSHGAVFSVKKTAIDFPRNAIIKFMTFDKLGEKHLFPKALLKAIGRASVISSETVDGKQFVSITLDAKGNMVVTGSKQLGEVKEKIAPDKEWSFPKGFTLNINPKYFSNILSVNREFYIKDEKYLVLRDGDFDVIVSLVSVAK